MQDSIFTDEFPEVKMDEELRKLGSEENSKEDLRRKYFINIFQQTSSYQK